jgi:ribosomal protein L11 methyltransferase
MNDAELCTKIGDSYDVICANIVAGIIVEMSPLFFSKLKKDGLLIASGIISERETEVKSALEKAGFVVLEASSEDDWSAILAKKL